MFKIDHWSIWDLYTSRLAEHHTPISNSLNNDPTRIFTLERNHFEVLNFPSNASFVELLGKTRRCIGLLSESFNRCNVEKSSHVASNRPSIHPFVYARSTLAPRVLPKTTNGSTTGEFTTSITSINDYAKMRRVWDEERRRWEAYKLEIR